jgi:hypothetical protein
LKKTIIIICCILAFLTIYTIAFQLYFGPPSMPDTQMTEQERREIIEAIADSLEDTNAAKYYLMAAVSHPPLPEDDDTWCQYEEVLQDGWLQENLLLERYIADNQTVFDLIRQGSEQKEYFVPTRGDLIEDLIYWGDFRHFARLLMVKGRMHEAHGEHREAVNTYADLLRFSADLADNGPLVNAMRGFAFEGLAYAGLDSLVANFDDEGICHEMLTELIEIEDSRVSLGRLIENEHIGSRQFQGYLVEMAFDMGIPLDCPDLVHYFLDPTWRTYNYLVLRITLPGRLKEIGRFYEYLNQLSEKPYPEILHENLEDKAPTDELTGIWSETIEKFMLITARYETERRANILKVALRLHQLRSGGFPGTLDEISPTVPAHILIDPFSTERFKYRKTDDGYLLYSVGFDFDDDGGKSFEFPFKLDTDGDIVFEPSQVSPAQASTG